MSISPAISVQNLTKTFDLQEEKRSTLKERFVKGRSKSAGTFTALDNISFDIPRGTTFGLVGHNGSGKSTLLKILAGVYRPTSGIVKVDGRVSALLELGAGFHGDLTGRENIRLNGAILGLSRQKVRDSMDKIIEFAEIGDFIDVPVKNYSSGMYVRLGFAIAVMLEPEILIVDEVIAVGDESFQRKSFDHMYNLRKKGVTIALVTHSMELAQELCDEALWLDGGIARTSGSITEVVGEYVKEVNRREKLRLEAALEESGQDLVRRGEGSCLVTDTHWEDSAGQPTSLVEEGPHSVVLDIESEKPVEDVAISVRIHQENGQLLGVLNSAKDGKTFDLPAGGTRISYQLSEVPLQPGTYWVSTSLRSHGHLWDDVDKGWRLVVRGEGTVEDAGVLKLSGEWQPSVTIDETGGAAEGDRNTDER